MVILHTKETGERFLVNPEAIVLAEPLATADGGSQIRFSDGRQHSVRETVDELAELLRPWWARHKRAHRWRRWEAAWADRNRR